MMRRDRCNLLNWLTFAIMVVVLLVTTFGCSSRPEIRIPEKVYVDRPVPCLRPDEVPPRPEIRTEAALLALDRYRRTHAVWAERIRLQAYASELEAILGACVAAAVR